MFSKGFTAVMGALMSAVLALSVGMNDDLLTKDEYWDNARSVVFSKDEISGKCRYIVDTKSKSIYFDIKIDDLNCCEEDIFAKITFSDDQSAYSLRVIPSQDGYEQGAYKIKAMTSCKENGDTVFRIGITPPKKALYTISASLVINNTNIFLFDNVSCDLTANSDDDDEPDKNQKTTKPKTTKETTTRKSTTKKHAAEKEDDSDSEESANYFSHINDMDESEESRKSTHTFIAILVGCAVALTAYAIYKKNKQE